MFGQQKQTAGESFHYLTSLSTSSQTITVSQLPSRLRLKTFSPLPCHYDNEASQHCSSIHFLAATSFLFHYSLLSRILCVLFPAHFLRSSVRLEAVSTENLLQAEFVAVSINETHLSQKFASSALPAWASCSFFLSQPPRLAALAREQASKMLIRHE